MVIQLKQRQEAFQESLPLSKQVREYLRDWFHVELTYINNLLEGNSLTRDEVRLAIEQSKTVAGHSVAEYVEVHNYYQALLWIEHRAERGSPVITEQDLLAIHAFCTIHPHEDVAPFRIIKQNISEPAGSRNSFYFEHSLEAHNGHIMHDVVKELVVWINSRLYDEPIAVAVVAHNKLVSIKPFISGNSLAARLFADFLLHMAHYPPLLFDERDVVAYRELCEFVEKGSPEAELTELFFLALNRSFDIYFGASEQMRQRALSEKQF